MIPRTERAVSDRTDAMSQAIVGMLVVAIVEN